ncbi:SpoIIE family protein phosphatase [Streptomyces sp. FH025]|uniref:SpoIIE family protein phosphatase n=1 Tax=Streptomyces sp. FH025 TaxID=2815937 RepID=UPI001A9F35BB|nr:SpoIIE family protein phosphatase [Streptomyces sp. FH025]MBO1419192.1 SpoIIE family protein phosphatase [Streptomyces sp. FH025]
MNDIPPTTGLEPVAARHPDLVSTATAVLDGTGVVIGWTQAAEELLGYRPADVISRPGADLLATPEDVRRTTPAAAQCRAGRAWGGLVALRHRDGRRIDAELRVSPPFGLDARECFLVSAVDLTRPPSWAVNGQVLEGFLTRSPVGMAVLDPELRYVWMNDTLERWGGVARAERLGRGMESTLPGLDTKALEDRMRKVLDTGEPVLDYEYRGWTLAEPRNEHAYSTSFFRLVDADGNLLGVCYMAMDVTDRWKAQERLGLVKEAGTRIGSTLDIVHTAQELADLAVPSLADFVAVDLLESVLQGEEPAPASVTTRPAMRRAGLRSVREGSPEAVAAVGDPINVLPPFRGGRYLVQGEPLLVPVLDPAEDNAWSVEHPARGAKIREFGLHSLIAAPLRARGVTLGLATFVRSLNPAPFEPDDLLLAEELATRAAVCVDNARRYTREHTASLALQHSLLPHALTSGPALEVASRYVPTSTPGDVGGVGGDWFDVIPLSGARVALVVGDVAGHGITAAATMGRMRTAVHTLADMDLPPDELLAHLDDLVIRLIEEEPEDEAAATAILGATCLYAVYDPVTGRCAMARAGHPPPALVTPGGTVTFYELPAGPPLGLGSLPFECAEVDLPEGSIIALYTDGLIETFDRDIDLGRLGRTLTRTDLPLDDLCATVIDSLPPGPPIDDVALLVARTRVLAPSHVATWDLPPDPSAVSDARSLATTQLAQWDLRELELAVELIVSELVTNAIRYAPGPIRLRLIRHSVLICEVFDTDSTAPRLRHARTTDEGGRGLFIVAQLAHRWGTRFTAEGKIIWAECALSESV